MDKKKVVGVVAVAAYAGFILGQIGSMMESREVSSETRKKLEEYRVQLQELEKMQESLEANKKALDLEKSLKVEREKQLTKLFESLPDDMADIDADDLAKIRDGLEEFGGHEVYRLPKEFEDLGTCLDDEEPYATATRSHETDLDPFVGSLSTVRGKSTYSCGGSFLEGGYFVTAAHCVTGGEEFTVKDHKGNEISHEKVYSYMAGGVGSDIAIIKLKKKSFRERVKSSGIKLSTLPSEKRLNEQKESGNFYGLSTRMRNNRLQYEEKFEELKEIEDKLTHKLNLLQIAPTESKAEEDEIRNAIAEVESKLQKISIIRKKSKPADERIHKLEGVYHPGDGGFELLSSTAALGGDSGSPIFKMEGDKKMLFGVFSQSSAITSNGKQVSTGNVKVASPLKIHTMLKCIEEKEKHSICKKVNIQEIK